MTVLEFAETIVRMQDRLNYLETEEIKKNIIQRRYVLLQRLCKKHSEDMLGYVRTSVHRPNVEDALKAQEVFYEAIKQLDNKF